MQAPEHKECNDEKQAHYATPDDEAGHKYVLIGYNEQSCHLADM